MATSLEKTANIATIVVVFAACVALSWQFYTNAEIRARRASAGQPTFKVGDAMATVPGIDYAEAQRTLLLMVSNTCKYCTESMPFYKKLTALRREGIWRFIAVATENVETTTEYLAASGIRADQVVSVPLGTVGARGTPTIVVVDKTGHVLALWAGLLIGEKEEAVVRAVLGRTD